MEQKDNTEAQELGSLLLEIGVSLLSSGASCSRIRITMRRFATTYNYAAHISIAPKSISLTLKDKDDISIFNGMLSTPSQGVNFKTLSGISRLSWRAVENKLSIQQVREELNQLLALPHYPRIIILIFVSLAGSAFCFSFGGKVPEMFIAFGATFCGLFVRQEAVKNKFNPYISVFFASLVASLFAGAFIKAGLNISFEHAFATSVLFLIPGVPLINSFTDLIDGNILNGLVRGINALMFSMAIAFGLLIAMLIYNLN
ncbi:inner membrane protein YjjP [mine drainage metagenome]|uniref:Inner membrane protein YjjP n=1 Tax=mine drainage metagenome TaxID=410659 RepID=A0A1J5SVW4_9ZZZZ